MLCIIYYCRFDQEVNTFIQVNEYGHLVELNNSKKGKLVIINKSSRSRLQYQLLIRAFHHKA